METPSSTARRVTRSQAMAAANSMNHSILMSRKVEEIEKSISKSSQINVKQQQQDRSALIDITNDSPIVGLASGALTETPSSAMSKKRNSIRAKNMTPGSGEALLRGQVKNLLQKVEEEAEISRICLENRPPFHIQGFGNSPMALLAPTPANTPHVLNLSADSSVKNSELGSNGDGISPVQDKLIISQMITEISEGNESEKTQLTRSLLMDFFEKSEVSDSSDCSSVLTDQGKEKSSPSFTEEDDGSSVWSIQVNASSIDEEEEEEEEEGIEEDEEIEYDDYEQKQEEEGFSVDELCEGMRKIDVNGFRGKHTRFVYNSDGEIEGEEDSSPGVLRLKGLPTPKGKHVRFEEEETD